MRTAGPARGSGTAEPQQGAVPEATAARAPYRGLRRGGLGAGGRDMASRGGGRSRNRSPPGTAGSRARFSSGRNQPLPPPVTSSHYFLVFGFKSSRSRREGPAG